MLWEAPGREEACHQVCPTTSLAADGSTTGARHSERAFESNRSVYDSGRRGEGLLGAESVTGSDRFDLSVVVETVEGAGDPVVGVGAAGEPDEPGDQVLDYQF